MGGTLCEIGGGKFFRGQIPNSQASWFQPEIPGVNYSNAVCYSSDQPQIGLLSLPLCCHCLSQPSRLGAIPFIQDQRRELADSGGLRNRAEAEVGLLALLKFDTLLSKSQPPM